MSSENFNTTGGGDDATGAGNDDNLHDALGETGETDFVLSDDAATGGAKKPSPLVLLGLVLAVAGGGYLWYARGGPASAEAAAAATDADAATQTVSKFLDGGSKNVAMMEQMLRDTEKVVQQFLSYPSMKQVPLADLHTNPFRFKSPTDELAAPSETEAAARRRREQERQAVLKAVGALNLQSVIHSGSLKSCMINNTLYTEGQQVDTFIVERINPGAVIVKSGVYRFELRMQK